jgi:hypothetical protein
MKKIIPFLMLLVLFLSGLLPAPDVKAAGLGYSKRPNVPWRIFDTRYLHVATAENTVGAVTYLDHPRINGLPNARFIVQQNINPGGGSPGAINDRNIALWYNSTAGRWAIVNQDFSSMPVGSYYNVLIPYGGSGFLVHTVAAADTSISLIDSYFTNGEPTRLLFVTPVLNPGGGTSVYNDHPVGVFYDAIYDRWAVMNEDGVYLTPGASFFVLVEWFEHGNDFAFFHTATPESMAGDGSLIYHPAVNGDTHALVFTTQVWNPPGSSGVYNPYSSTVYYDTANGRWGIRNLEPGASPGMTPGAAFNVLTLPGGERTFSHTVASENLNGYLTWLDSSNLNLHPYNLFLFTHSPQPGGRLSINENLGAIYDSHAGHWSIYNQDQATHLQNGDGFNILIPNLDAGVFIHRASSGNITANWTVMDHPLLNHRPEAIFFVSPVFNPGQISPGVALDHPVGVWYYSAVGRWAIYNQDLAAMPVDARFTVFIPHPDESVFVHTVTSITTPGYRTFIDHPRLNHNPHAFLLVTQSWNPPGSSGVYNDSPVGVFYGDGKWMIFNEDSSNIPLGASFNVYFRGDVSYLPFVGR